MEELLKIGLNLESKELRPNSSPSPADVTPLGREAASLWSTLNKLAQTDPEGYDRYVKTLSMQAESPKKSFKRELTHPDAGICVSVEAGCEKLVTGDLESGRPPRQLRPPWLTMGTRLFINLCFHDSLSSPVTAGGENASQSSLALSLSDLFNLNIPIALSPVRRCTSPGAAMAPAAVIDVLAHSWVLTMVNREPQFKREYTAFAIRAVEDELLVDFPTTSWVEEPTSRRYWGLREDGKTLPFPYESQNPSVPGIAESLGLGGKKKKGLGVDRGEKGPQLADILRSLERSSAPSIEGVPGEKESGEETGGGILGDLNSIGKRLGATATSQEASSKDNATPQGEHKDAAAFAAFVSANLPEDILLFKEGVLDVQSIVEGVDGGLRQCITTITFSPTHVDTRAQDFMDKGDLELDGVGLKFSLPPSLLPKYDGLSIPLVPLVRFGFPEGVRVESSLARAKYRKKEGVLRVTVPVL